MDTKLSESSSVRPQLRVPKSRTAIILFVLLLLLLVVTTIITGIGATRVPAGDILRVIGAHITHANAAVPNSTETIIWQIRFPRVLLEILVGASLAAAGVSFQALLRNPLAEPYTIGVSSGAAVGVGLTIVLGCSAALGGFAMPIAAFAGSVATLALVYILAQAGGKVDVRSLLLSGVIAGSFLWAVQMLLLRLAAKDDNEILNWMMGSFAGANWSDVALLAGFTTLGVLLIAVQSRSMNLYALGDETARHLGLEVESFKVSMIVIGALLTAATVSVAGIIGFVGLVVPHISRRLAGTSDHRVVLPIAILGGALMTEVADTITRLAMSGEQLPVGAVTALLGCPFFFYLLRQSRS